MTIGSSPSIAAADAELGRASNVVFSNLNDLSMRSLAQVSMTPGVPWAMSSLIGKTGYPNSVSNVGKDPGSSTWGYNNPSVGGHGGSAFGSMSPATALGQPVGTVQGTGSTTDILILGAWAKSDFTSLVFKTSVNTTPLAIYNTASAVIYNIIAGVYTVWSWSVPDYGSWNWASQFGGSMAVIFQK